MQDKHLHVGHRSRLKTKFERSGLDGFADHEVLEYLLTFAIPQKDVNPLAHQLINHFGSLNAVLDATKMELENIKGVGPHAAALLTLMPKLFKRYVDNPAADKRCSLLHIYDRLEYFPPKFVGETEECLYAAFLNNNFEVLGCDLMTRGSLDAIKVEIRKLIDAASRYRATVVILAHNHQSVAEPSVQDITLTSLIYSKLEVCDITLADHIIVCKNEAISMNQRGDLNLVR